MAQTNYSKTNGRAVRRPGTMARGEYLCRVHEFCARGNELPQTKLLAIDIVSIRSASRQRQALLKHIRENLSNEALAKQFNVHVRTIEKVLSRESGSHVA